MNLSQFDTYVILYGTETTFNIVTTQYVFDTYVILNGTKTGLAYG